MRWLRRLTRRTHTEADLAAEIKFHLEEEVRRRVERGEHPLPAGATARRLFGNVAAVQDTTREMWAWAGLMSAWRSVSLIVRSFTQAWGFAVAAMLTVALGIGANTLAFSMFDRVLFRPLPYADPDRLVQIQTRDRPLASNGPDGATLELPIMHALAREKDLFTGIAWANGGHWSTGGGGIAMTPVAGENPELWLTSVTWDTLNVLGVRPVIGTGLPVAAGGDPALPVLLTYETWQRRYGGSDNVLSLSWTAPSAASRNDDVRWRVVGVLPKGFLLPTSQPLRGELDGIFGIDPRFDQPATSRQITVAPFARLAPGVSLAAARARANTITAIAYGRTKVTIEPLQTGMGVAVRPYVWLAVAGAWAVLGATCLTLAILLLTWSHSRRQEAGVRLALGASPRRLVITAVLESAVLSCAGAAIGWLGYLWTRPLFVAAIPLGLQSFATEIVDVRVIAATFGAALVSAAAAGALPAVRISRIAPLDVMRAPRAAALLDRLIGGPVLLAAQAAFGVTLLVGAAATVPSALGFVLKSPGFDAADLFVVSIATSGDATAANALEQTRRGFTAMDVVRQLPGVVGVALSTRDPFERSPVDRMFSQRMAPSGFDGRLAAVSAEFFRVLGTNIVTGRAFSVSDIEQQSRVAVVNESAVRVLWPNQLASAAIGRTVATRDGSSVVVGVAADIRIDLAPRADPMIFLPLSASEFYYSANSSFPWNSYEAIVRMKPGRVLDRVLVGERLSEQSWRHPDLRTPIGSFVTAELEPRFEKPRLLAAVFGGLGAIILVLTTTTVFGLSSFETRRRREEMTVRLALGATPWMLRRSLAAGIVKPVLAGVLAGLPFGWVEVKLISLSIPLVNANDVRIYAGAAAAILFAALVAAWLPGRGVFTMRAAELLRSP
jgi:predicted permease